MNPSHKLQDLRIASDLSRESAAHLLGFYSRNQIYRIESGKAKPCPRTERLILLWERCGLDALRAVQP